MRAAPPLELNVTCYGAWRIGLALLVATAWAALAAWWWSMPEPRQGWIDAIAALGAVAPLWAAVSLRNPGPLAIGWDRERWQLDRGDPATQVGDLAVAIDLGRWMLLRFTPDVGQSGRRTAWIPVQRRGHEAQWHALRCALFAPRPPADSGIGNA